MSEGRRVGRLQSTVTQLGLMYWAATLPPLESEPPEECAGEGGEGAGQDDSTSEQTASQGDISLASESLSQ